MGKKSPENSDIGIDFVMTLESKLNVSLKFNMTAAQVNEIFNHACRSI